MAIVGTNPSSTPTGTASGDLAGSYPGPTVAKIQGRAVSSSAPAEGQALVWNAANSDWEPTASDIVQAQSGATGMTHTGDTNEAILSQFTIPAGMLGANGLVQVFFLGTKAGTAGTGTWRTHFGTAGTIIDTAIGTTGALGATTVSVLGGFFLGNQNSASAQIGFPNPTTLTSTSAAPTTAINTTTTLTYVTITGQLGSAADTIGVAFYTAIVIPHA